VANSFSESLRIRLLGNFARAPRCIAGQCPVRTNDRHRADLHTYIWLAEEA
jgi:hypothetical protein